MGLKRADKRRLDELRVEFGMKESSTKKLVRSRLKCAGHMYRMGAKNIIEWEIKTLAKRADAQKVEGKRRRRSSRMRWEDCVKRDLERMGGQRSTTAKDRRSCRLLIENAVREK